MTTTRRSPRAVLAVGLLVALLLAGVVSFYASSSPDGLERVAEDTGFAAGADAHPLEDAPLADYTTAGVDDQRLSGGLAGVVGVAITFLLGAALAVAVRRRGGGSDAPAADEDLVGADPPGGPGR